MGDTSTNLSHSKLKVFLRDVLPSFTQRVHSYRDGKSPREINHRLISIS
jgi:hypothetical protein